MIIELQHRVPIQHETIYGTGVKFTAEERNLFCRHADLMTGPYSEQEDTTIRRNWLNFCQVIKDGKKVRVNIFI